MPGFDTPFQEPPRKKSKGEVVQEHAGLAKMATRLLGMSFTENEFAALTIVLNALEREAPKVERSNLVKLIKMMEGAIK